jgi:hypothetical protein
VKPSRRRLRTATVTLVIGLGMGGCSAAPSNKAPVPGPNDRLRATLVSPTDIRLDWKDDEPTAAGRIVEYANESDGQYTILQFVPAHQTTYTHPDLIPETPFYYRVRPYFGPASGAVDIALPKGPVDETAEGDDQDWAAPRTVPHGTVATQSIRAPNPSAAAAPTDLQATIVHGNGIRFTWTDHASDEEGYLLEVKPAGRADFEVTAVLDPNVNSVGLVTLPDEDRASFRVRAFYYGPPTNIAYQTTGQERDSN